MQLRQAADDEEELDIFDFPEAEPNRLFLNPFACNIDPMSWRDLQVILSRQSMLRK